MKGQYKTGMQVPSQQQDALLQRIDLLIVRLDQLASLLKAPPQQGASWDAWLQRIAGDTGVSDSQTMDIDAIFSPKHAYGTSAGTGLCVILDTGRIGGRIQVEVWVKSSAAAVFEVAGSFDGEHYRTTDTIALTDAGEMHRGYYNAYRYIRVSTPAKNNNEIEIVASR